MSKHTPLPYHIGMKPGPMVYGPQGEQVVGLNVMLDIEEVTANAQYIIQACNAYPALVEALTELVNDRYLADPINNDRMAKAKAVLATLK